MCDWARSAGSVGSNRAQTRKWAAVSPFFILSELYSFVLFCFVFLCVLEVFKQLGACCHLLYWTDLICKCAWEQNKVTNAKADQ